MKKLSNRSLQIDQKLLQQLIRKIKDDLGLSFENKARDAEKALLRFFNTNSLDEVHSRIKQLLNKDLNRNYDLIDKLTIPETYFFRNHKLFSILEKEILPGLLLRKVESGQPLTIWSAGCSSGEEAYSIAMLIDQIQKNQAQLFPVRILATDINPYALQKAQKGIYSRWSFRNMPVKYMEEYFTPLDERHLSIAAHIKKMVHFERHNLKQGPFPVNNTWNSFDMIICRNVLIYFDRETMLEILQQFYNLLHADGYFISGPAEIPSLHFKQFKPQMIKNIIVYRKLLPPAIQEQSLQKERPIQKRALKVRHPDRYRNPKPNGQIKSKPLLSVENNNHQVDELTVIKNLADSGNLEEARRMIRHYLERNNLDARAHYLLGTIDLEMGKIAEAEASFQKVLYLKPNHIMAHFHLANLYTLNGQVKDSKIYFNNVLNLIQKYEPQQEIPDSEGMNANQFKQMIEKILKTNRLAS